MLISGRNPHDPLQDASFFDYHGCGCGWPNAAPPCSHCTDCMVCSDFCAYCGTDHLGEQDEWCPQVEWDLAIEKILL